MGIAAKCTGGLVIRTMSLMGRAAVGLVTTAAYAIGTFPTAVLVARGRGHDVLSEGSGNPGASNVYRVAGRRAGMAVFAVDLLKGALAAGIGLAVGHHAILIAGPAAVVGHCFPVTRRLRGGKGVATAAGFGLVLEPLIALAAAVVWVVVVKASHKASLASLVMAAAFPFAVAVVRGMTIETAVVAGVAALILVRHAGNVARLLRGQERTV